MKKFGLLLLSVIGVAALAACQHKGAATTAAASSDSAPVAVVNGQPISRAFFEFYVARVAGGRSSSDLTPDERARALDSLIRAQVVADQAEKDGSAAAPDTVNLLALSRLNVLEQTISAQYLKDRKPTEEQLHTEYEAQIAAMPHLEYHARHILVATEPFAEKIIERLDKGENFSDLAKNESMDSSKSNGGDLGWFTPDHMVKSFADAVVALKPGEYTHKPVHTEYGWHIIQLVETRNVTPPTYDSVHQRLVQIVESKEFTAYVDGLVKNAKVERKL